jgi:hypothetical protein
MLKLNKSEIFDIVNILKEKYNLILKKVQINSDQIQLINLRMCSL